MVKILRVGGAVLKLRANLFDPYCSREGEKPMEFESRAWLANFFFQGNGERTYRKAGAPGSKPVGAVPGSPQFQQWDQEQRRLTRKLRPKQTLCGPKGRRPFCAYRTCHEMVSSCVHRRGFLEELRSEDPRLKRQLFRRALVAFKAVFL